MVHQYANSKAPRLFYKDNKSAVPVTIETTIPAYTIKAMHRFCRGGIDKLAVCLDSPCDYRKKYFSENTSETTKEIAYKGDRKPMLDILYRGMELTAEILHKSGVSIYKAANFEADDLVYSLVQICKEMYPLTPIDVITNDADIVPLVDEQVSVFLKSRKFTWAESKELEKRGYYQVTPYNYEEVMSGLSKYQKFDMSYNTVLLHKLLRGDDADGIPGMLNPKTGRPDFPPTMYNELISYLKEDGVDIGSIFRYTMFKPRADLEECRRITENTGNVVKLKDMFEIRKEQQLNRMCEIMADYVDDSTIEHIKYIYGGMNLRYINVVPPKKYEVGVLRGNLLDYDINLPE